MGLNAYIDESGDEGFKFAPPQSGKGACSQWFTMAAVVVDKEKDLGVARAINRIKEERLLWPNSQKILHWKDLNHQQKKMVIQELRGKPFTLIVVSVNKKTPNMREKFDPEIVRVNNRGRQHELYFYTAKFLVEMLCAFAQRANTTINLIFEGRRGLTKEELCNRLSPITNFSQIDNISVKMKNQNVKMLQVADACAGAFNNALEPDRYGNIEDSYIKGLKGRLHRVSDHLWGGGIKLLPETEMKRAKRLLIYQWMAEI